nr:MAG: hypothetical protein [Microviridae sp.]
MEHKKVIAIEKTSQQIELENLENKTNEYLATNEDVQLLNTIGDKIESLLNDKTLHTLICTGKNDKARKFAVLLFNSYIDVHSNIQACVLHIRQEIQKNLIQGGLK